MSLNGKYQGYFWEGCCILVSLFLFSGVAAYADVTGETHKISIVVGDENCIAEMNAATVLKRRMVDKSEVEVIISTTPKQADLIIYLGKADADGNIAPRFAAQDITLPGRMGLFPEGFALKRTVGASPEQVFAVGADERGIFYAVGELLRHMRFEPQGIVLEDTIDVASAPAFRFRGFSANQGGTMCQVTGVRSWTTDELHEYMFDLMLAGANCLYAGASGKKFLKSLDVMTITGCRPNELDDAPKDWQASEFGHWVCPSIPEARAALLAAWDRKFKAWGRTDILRFYAGDPGGCRCERCMPWGKTFIQLSEEVAAVWLKHYPDTTVLLANQDVTNAGDQAIFDYLTEKPRTWLYGLAYGPGSNAMSSYFRSELREDLFTYPGCGPVNRYLAETLNQLPKEQRIVHYSDITHWISAQYEVEHPDPYVKGYYGRRTFHTRPKAFYQIFQRIMPFSEGDIIYSEGYHDEFHQYLWNRLLWDPNRSLDDVTLEYCQLHFGEEAAELMKEALYQLEENLELPMAENEGISRYYALVKEAGTKIPANLMKRNHRWRLHMQKAALDKCIQLRLRRALDQEARVKSVVKDGLASGKLDDAITEAQQILEESLETDKTQALHEEARRLGEESESLYGIRNVGFFSLDNQFRSLFSISSRIRKAMTTSSENKKRDYLESVANFELGEKVNPVMDR